MVNLCNENDVVTYNRLTVVIGLLSVNLAVSRAGLLVA